MAQSGKMAQAYANPVATTLQKGIANGDDCRVWFANKTDSELVLRSYNRDDSVCWISHAEVHIEKGVTDYIQALDAMFFGAKRCTSIQVRICSKLSGQCVFKHSAKNDHTYEIRQNKKGLFVSDSSQKQAPS